jgi:ribonuclease R
VSTLNDDYYQFVEKNLMLVGEHTRKVYKIGDPVRVVLTRVNIPERNIDFEIAPEEEPTFSRKPCRLDARGKAGIIKGSR